MGRPIDADVLKSFIRAILDISGLGLEPVIAMRDVFEMIDNAPTIDAIPVEYLMKYSQLPTEFAIAAWRKQDKDAHEKRIKRLDKPMSFDDALNLVNDVFPLGQKEQEART